MVDTNSDPRDVDYVIPSNDDASKSIEVIMGQVTGAVADGLAERKSEKQSEKEGKQEPKATVEKAPEAAAKPEATEEPKSEKVAEAAKEAPVTKEVVEEKAPVAEETPAKKEEGKTADDLTKIEGIGPKAAEALVNKGVESFAKLANAKPEDIKEILTEASSRMAHLDPGSWPKQAQMAADEKWDELKEWQDNVKGGVE